MIYIVAQLQWRAPTHLWIVLAFLVLIGAVNWRFYPPQLRSLSRFWRYLLPALRIVALAVLAICVLQPVLLHPKSPQEQGAILVLIDNSRSMSVTDPRSNSELVRLGEGLHLLPRLWQSPVPSQMQMDLSRLTQMADDVGQAYLALDFAQLTGQGQAAAQTHLQQACDAFRATASELTRQTDSAPLPLQDRLRELAKLPDPANPQKQSQWSTQVRDLLKAITQTVNDLDAAASDSLFRQNPEVRHVGEVLAQLSRFQLAELALTRPGTGLLSALDQSIPLYGFAVGKNAVALALQRGGKPVQHLLATPDANASDLTSCLREALRSVRPQQVQAIILFSDGRQVTPDATPARRSFSAGVPIFPVAVAPPTPGRPLGAELKTPASAPIHLQPNPDREMTNLSPDSRFLRQLAQNSGGEFLYLDQFHRIPAELAQAASQQSRFAELPLWASPYLFLFVLACFGTEWALRKQLGLP